MCEFLSLRRKKRQATIIFACLLFAMQIYNFIGYGFGWELLCAIPLPLCLPLAGIRIEDQLTIESTPIIVEVKEVQE
jgi:hypothetical protein